MDASPLRSASSIRRSLRALWTHLAARGMDVGALLARVDDVIIKTLLSAEAEIYPATARFLPNRSAGGAGWWEAGVAVAVHPAETRHITTQHFPAVIRFVVLTPSARRCPGRAGTRHSNCSDSTSSLTVR